MVIGRKNELLYKETEKMDRIRKTGKRSKKDTHEEEGRKSAVV